MKPVKSEDKKPFGDKSVHINLKVRSQDGMEVSFRLKRNKKLQTLINDYCDKQSKDTTGGVFVFNGLRLSAEKTPDEKSTDEPHAGKLARVVLAGDPETNRAPFDLPEAEA
nr:small ubiquitin-related modifier 1-like [Tanacetum cinerariifolium]